jgi:hypothetical protein
VRYDPYSVVRRQRVNLFFTAHAFNKPLHTAPANRVQYSSMISTLLTNDVTFKTMEDFVSATEPKDT